MDSSNPIICRLLLEGLKPLLHLEKTADTLFKEMGCLRAFKSDIQSHLVALETPQVKRSSQVERWMREVDSLNEEVGEFEESFIRRRVDCLGGCCSLGSLSANYHLGMRLISMLRRVRDLNGQGSSFTSLVDQPPPEMDQASSSVSVVGAEATLSAIREHLCNEHVKILGIYGMGGIGKTTLLSKIKNEMSVTRTQFDVVIWVTVSRDVNVLNIQKTICEQLGLNTTEKTKREQLGLNTQKTKRDVGAEISKDVLSEKKILLILDNVWERLDLEKMGVPLPSSENKWKIAITTRSEQVCISMGAHHKIKVPPLTSDESWELFREKVGVEVDINNPSILPHAMRVVAKCGGLPLTLVTVGRAMVDATTAEKWVEAIKKMGNPYDGIRGMRDVYSLLKFSYDGLENNTLRHCLLFCSLFPEDSDIHIDDLINLWVGEGILLEEGSDDCLNSARKHGRSVVNKLKAACLLGSGSDEELYVNLHDGVRDMILWISSGDWDKTSGDWDNLVLLSYAGLGLTRFPPVKRWGEARWISIGTNEIEEVPDEIPSCPNLLVLIMTENNFSLTKSIPDSFFTFMPILRVLDLSATKIKELPKSVGSLVELRLLDVSWSKIISLPEEIGNLAKLRILDLRGTPELAVVPRESILKLSSLHVLNISVSSYTWDNSDGQEEIPDNNFKQLESLGLTIGTSHFLEKLLSYPVWSKAMDSLSLNGGDMTSPMISRTCEVMRMLVFFYISNNDRLEELIFSDGQLMKLLQLKMWRLPLLRRIVLRKEEDDEVVGASRRCCLLPSLRTLEIWSCHNLEELNWVSQLSSLTRLDLFDCSLIEELIVDGCDEKEEETNQTYAPFLPNLVTMKLEILPNLKSISRRLLPLPSLQRIHVSCCPKLKKLPFRNDSAKKIEVIRGTQRWWDELEWEEDNIRLTFFQHFTACPCYFCEREREAFDVDVDEEEEEEEEEENNNGRAPEHEGEEEDGREIITRE